MERTSGRRGIGTGRSGKDLPDHASGHVGQAEVAAGVVVGQHLVVEPHEGQERGVQVGRVHPAFDGMDSVLVGRAVRIPLLHAGAGEPHRVAGDVVVPAVLPLGGRQPPELAAEQDERVVEKSSLLEIGQERGGRLIRRRRVADEPLVEVVVMVPPSLADLDEADPRLAQPAGDEALPGKAPAGPGFTP